LEILNKNLVVPTNRTRVEVVTKRFNGKNLIVTLNNESVSSVRYSNSRSLWIITLDDLEEGRNKLVVSLPDGTVTDRSTVTYRPMIASGGNSKPDPIESEPVQKPDPVEPKSPSVPGNPLIKYTGSKKFDSEQATVIIQTEKVFQKGLSFTLNGQEVSFSKSKSYAGSNTNKTDWKLNLQLREGNNRLAYKAANKNGSNPGEFLLNYKKKTLAPGPEASLSNKAVMGIRSSLRSGFSKDCIALYAQDKLKVLLLPNKRVELQSFKVYTNICGGLKVTLEGDGDSQSFRATLNDGGSNISFTPIDAELQANLSYTLIVEPLGNYRGCDASDPPRLEKITDCNFRSNNHAALKIDQNSNPIIHDLKIKYE